MSFFSKIKEKFNSSKILVLAEKYTAAAEYSAALNCTKKDGYFEGDKYVIAWTDGHLCTLYSPEDYDNKYKTWKLEDLPIVPNGFWIKTRKGKEGKIKIIKDLINREDVKGVCIGTDSAREGNLIGEYTLMAIENKKPVYRVMISALNRKEILQGFKNIEPNDKYINLTLSAQARNEIDWLIGTSLSRAYSLTNSKKYYVGRCKTVILNILCKREEEVNSFKSKVYYSILGFFNGQGYEYAGSLNKPIESKNDADKIVNEIKGSEGQVSNISKEYKVIEPDPLYNLNDLIRAVNRRYGYAADDIYNIAQKLYEDHKLISYARTDCRYIRSSMIDEIKMTLNCIKNGNSKDSVHDIKDVGVNLFIKRCVDDEKVTEHTAIIPVFNEKVEETYKLLEPKEKNVYDEIVNNFISNFLSNYEYESISIETIVKGYKFITKTQKIINPGWKDERVVNNNFLDLIKENDVVILSDIKAEKRITKGPDRYTDDTLFEVLESPGRFIEDKNLKKIIKGHGIGTNATRALILKNLVEDDYVTRENKYLIPTIEGQELINSLKTDKLKEPFFTAEIEDKLQGIEKGSLDKDEVLKEVINFIREHVEELKKDYKPIIKNNVIGICPWCNKGKIVEAGDKGYGCTELKTTDCRFYLSNNILGTFIDTDQVYKLITCGETDELNFQGKKGPFKARIIFSGKATKFKKC